jgi:acyl-CoA reductase-like NAD-dependent aldehyde dehydrogenase
VRAARAAFPAWRDLAPDRRARILLRVAELIEAEQERLTRIESHDVGKPIREAALVDLPACWAPWRYYQGLVRAIDGRVPCISPAGSVRRRSPPATPSS